MVTNSFGNRNFMQSSMGRLSMCSWWALFLPFGGGVGGVFFCFSSLFSMCSSCSLEVPQVPNLFPKEFPKAPQFYPIWFAQSSALMYINWKGILLGEYICIYFANGGPKRCLPPLGSAQCSKKIADGLLNMVFRTQKKKKKKVMGAPIN